MPRKVVITGAGVICSQADSPSALHRALCGGRGGSGIIDFDPKTYLGDRNTRPLDRTAQLVAAAASLALDDSGWSGDDRQQHEIGLVVGTVFSSLRTICEFDRRTLALGPGYASPLDFANTVLNAAAGQAAIWHRLRGPNATIATGVASGLHSIAYATDLIASGSADAVLAGGADERSSEALGALERAGLLSGGTALPIPYGAQRTGFALGEGAALVMLEAADLAAARGAAVQAEVRGHASGNASSGDNETAIVDAFVAETIVAALVDAGAVAHDIDAVSASASGSVEVDACEAGALAMALCPGGRSVPVMAVKSVLGEVLGASGALQVIAILEAARSGCVPGISGLERPGVETTCLDLRAGARPVRVKTALIDAIGWDGNCCALVVDAISAVRRRDESRL